MTFDAFESGAESGHPVETYVFTSPSQTWAYTSGEDAQTLDSVDYEPVAISRANIEISPGKSDNTLKVRLPVSSALAQH